jgi:hypothetical protein
MKSNKDLTTVEFEVAQGIKRAMHFIENDNVDAARLSLKYALADLYRE